MSEIEKEQKEEKMSDFTHIALEKDEFSSLYKKILDLPAKVANPMLAHIQKARTCNFLNATPPVETKETTKDV